MAVIAVMNVLSKRQRICTYFTVSFLSFLGGVEFAVILPTLYLHLENTYHAPNFYLGLIISAFSFSGLFVSPLMGRVYDKTRWSKLLISLTNVFECCGSIMYWIGLSPMFLIFSRLVAGLGNGFFPIVLAELSHSTTNKQRTSMVSAVMAMRQLGILIGPGFNVFLAKLHFYIGPLIVNEYTSPGLFLALLWLIAELLVIFMYHPLTKLVPAPELAPATESASATKAADQSSSTKEPVISNGTPITSNGTPVTSNGTVKSANTDYDIVEVDPSSGAQSPHNASATVNEDTTSAHILHHRSLKQILLDITHDEYMAIYMLSFVAMFNQSGMETMFTPLCTNYLGWTELQISLLFCGAGGLVLISFFAVHICSKKFCDRTLIIFGSLCQIVTLAWCLYWIPTFQKNNSANYIKYTVILIPGLVINIFGLPFLFVCHISLFSKLLHADIQGIGHGMRRVTAGIAAILGPLWASSLLQEEHTMFGVMLGLNILALLLIFLSYKKLYIPVTADLAVERSESTAEVNENSRLINS